jgi:hypothetical protein
VFHPVGPLPARVYWRRRLVVLIVLLAVAGGGTWLTLRLVSARADDGTTSAAGASSPVPVPALERVVPSPETVVLPRPPDQAALAAAAEAAPVVAGPAPGGPCTDDMIGVDVRSPATAAIGSKPTFELVITNVSAVPCVRALDKARQEIQLYDAAGTRRWGSNDCFPEAGDDLRTLAPGEAVSFPVVWGGLTSEPGCAAPRGTPPPGAYTLVGRLDTKLSPPAPLTLG